PFCPALAPYPLSLPRVLTPCPPPPPAGSSPLSPSPSPGPPPLSPSPSPGSSPPVPLSLRERGDDEQLPERVPHELFELLAGDFPIPHTDDTVARGFEKFRTGGIIDRSVAPGVHVTLH